LVYALAAYTITVSVLVLYGVVLQHRERVHAVEVSEAGAADGGGAVSAPAGFNVGAALLSPFWMWHHGMRLPGALLLALCLALVPLYRSGPSIALVAVGIVLVAAGAALGVVGNRIAAAHRGDGNVARLSASQLPWAVVGVALYTVVLPWGWFWLRASS
jgi:hypothetical protein